MVIGHCRVINVSGSLKPKIVFPSLNRVALGPKGWGRAGPDCAIQIDSRNPQLAEKPMTETIRLDGVDVAFTTDNVSALYVEPLMAVLYPDPA